MESEAIGSVRIAVNLMIVSVLLFSIILFVKIAKPGIFDIIMRVVNVTDEEKTRQFEDYDQKWVPGTKVLRALKLYEGTEFGIVYQTVATRSSGGYAENYGGIFQGSGAYSHGYRILNFSAWKTRAHADDTFYTKGFIKDAAGKVIRYENKVVTRRSPGDLEYIPPDGRFYAELIRDVTGEIIGICFTQQ